MTAVETVVVVVPTELGICEVEDELPPLTLFNFCFKCTLACLFFSSDLANLRVQTSHENGFSPV